MKHIHTFENFLNEKNYPKFEVGKTYIHPRLGKFEVIELGKDSKTKVKFLDGSSKGDISYIAGYGSEGYELVESTVNEGATPRLLKSAGQNLARQVKDKKNYTVDQLKDRLLSMPLARMLSDDEILIVLDHAKEELGMNEARVAATDKIIIPTLSDIDHTRIVKWCSANGIKDCEWEKSGDGYIMDTSKMPIQDQQDLDKYLFASRIEYTREFTKK